MTLYVGRQQRVGDVAAHVAACDGLSPSRFRGRHRVPRRRRHRRGPTPAREVRQPQRRRPDDAGRGRHGRPGRVGVAELARLHPRTVPDRRADPGVQARRAAVRPPARIPGRRRRRPAPVPEAHGLHRRGHPPRRPAHPPRPGTTAPASRITPAAPPCCAACGGSADDRPPHGDRMFRLGRSVPVATVLVDTPDAIARSFDIVDELTAEHGLVTSEMVPAMLAIDGGNRRGGTRLARHRY